MREVIGPLVDFNYWASGRLLGAVDVLGPDGFTREVGREFSSPTLQGMLGHIMGAEALWLGRWRGSPSSPMERGDAYPTPAAALRERWTEAERDFRGFVERQSEAALAREIEYRALNGQSYRSLLWQMGS